MRGITPNGFAAPVIFAVLSAGLIACGDGATPTTDRNAAEPLTITIGNHTDLTQAPSQAIALMNLPLEDMVRYYNENDIIPGVRFDIVTFDGKYNSGQDLVGYRQLKTQGADLMFSSPPGTPTALKPYLAQDKMVLFAPAPLTDAIEPPGWVFGVGTTTVEKAVYTLLEWVAANDPGFPEGRPARIGGAFWDEPYHEAILEAARAYCLAHPEKYEWVFGRLTEWKSWWGPEVQALLPCDYVIPNAVMYPFAEEFRQAGGTARFLAPEPHLIFLGQVDQADLWEELEGTLFARTSLWWTDEGEVMDFVKDLLHQYHPENADDIRREGVAYVTGQHMYLMFQIIRETVDAVGVEGFSSKAIYDTALTFSTTMDGAPHSFNESKRTSADVLAIYEIRAEQKDLYRADPGWVPIVEEP